METPRLFPEPGGEPLTAAGEGPAAGGYADIALPVPLDRPFTYAVAAGQRVAPGMRVLAPWGPRRLEGVVVAVHASLPAGLEAGKIKTILEVLDGEPLLETPMLELVAWAAAYYQAPIGEVMRCALPPGGARQKAPLVKRYRLGAAAAPGTVVGKNPAQKLILELLAGGPVEAGALRRQASASALASLAKRGAIEAYTDVAAMAAPAWSPRARVAELNSSQRLALSAIEAALEGAPLGMAKPILLHGVTGSGKTAVYIAAIEAVLERGDAVLLLVPEIGLTPALFADFEDAFPGLVAVLHSGLGASERALHWQRLRSGVARVAIGTRSAVFAPVAALRLIIVDEEHDASFKQQESPRYHGRDLAVLRASFSRAAVVLGSATPSLETFAHARKGKYQLVEMAERVGRRPLPAVRVVDMAEEFRLAAQAAPPRKGERPPELVFSKPLVAALEARLACGQQALVLINRRGFAPVVLCRACGATVMCRDCALSLTFHKRASQLVCHLCGFTTETPRLCPGCGSEHLYFLGSGSEKIEEELAALLPAARIARLDRDTARTKRHFEQVLGQFRQGKYDILIGTQMIAKGHDVANVTLVGVLQADLGLTFPDFRAAERTFQLLTQVAGRAGRGVAPGEVLLQVTHPEHYAVAAAAQGDFAGFYEKEANFRRWMHYPPFVALALVQLRHTEFDQVLRLATAAGQFLESRAAEYAETKILGPSPALLARAKTEYRFQFLFKSKSRRELSALLGELREFALRSKFPATGMIVDVDPLNL